MGVWELDEREAFSQQMQRTTVRGGDSESLVLGLPSRPGERRRTIEGRPVQQVASRRSGNEGLLVGSERGEVTQNEFSPSAVLEVRLA